MQALFSSNEFNLIITILLFIIFLYAGYVSDKKSGGFFLVFAGFILVHSLTILIDVLPVLAIVFMPLLALYLIFIGFYKFLYQGETESED